MKPTWPPSGRYILAVSGGADSMVLLDLLAGAATTRQFELIVAHFDHGIRTDSYIDAEFVRATAMRHHLSFELSRAKLAGASEATARQARHDWLELMRRQHGASAIITAHHQDDLIETSLLNVARGSGRRGLAPMQPGGHILRPLLNVPRNQLRAYAAEHQVTWREDSTNQDLSNPRNLLRHRLLAEASPAWRQNYLERIAELAGLNEFIDQIIAEMLAQARQDNGDYAFPKAQIRTYSVEVIRELIATAARIVRPGLQLDATLIGQAAALAHTAHTGKQRPLRGGLILEIRRSHIYLITKSPL